jgi:hypothetical protein
MKKHGAYWETDNHGFTFYWMGEEVKVDDFNERLMNQARSVAKDVNMMQLGMDIVDSLNEGEKTVAQLEEVEKIAKLPLCADCRKLIGEIQK